MWEQLRKFGMGHCDLPTMVWNVAFMLRGLTLNIDTRNKGSIPMIFYIILPVLIVSYLYAYFISTIWFVFVRCVETRDLTAAMIVFSLGTTSEIGIAKFINACINRKKIRVLIQEYLRYDADTVEPGSRFSKNLLKNLRNVKKRAIIYWVVIINNGILYICKPLVTPGQKTTEDKFIHYKLEPQFETPNYQLNYIFSAAGSILTCYPTANMAAFLIIVAGYVEAQLLALSEELFNLWDDAEQQSTSMYAENVISKDEEEVLCEVKYDAVNELITMKLRKIIIGHTTMIQFMLQVKEIFRGAFAFEFIILSVGLISELLGGLENTYPLVPFAIIQVGMDCFTGQRVIDACEFFEYAVYSCKWERFNVINRRTVFLLYINSQKTLTLSAGGIAILSFTTLMSVFKSIYSAFATLQSVM